MNKQKLVLTSGIANTFEWYDYALFGHFAPIIGRKFFPDTDPDLSLLQAFLVFAIGYLMRPLGGILFGVIGDKYGRRTALSAAIICMAFPTALIGMLPTYETVGSTATILMIVIRMMQGLSMGGTLTGSISFVIEHSQKEHRGIFGSVSMSSICIGVLLGSSAFCLAQNLLTHEQLYDWGWRIPFLVGILIFFAGIYIKKHTLETPLFQEAQYKGELDQSPLRTALSEHWFDMIISIFINSTGSILFYVEAIYLVSYLKINRGFDSNNVSNLINLCYILMAGVTLLTGWLSDKVGRRKIFIINLSAIIILSPILFQIYDSGSFTSVIIAQIILAILAAAYIGPEPALQAEFYPTKIRNTALSVSYNIAVSIFGGTAPYILTSLVYNSGTITSCVYYIIVSAILSLFALYFYKDRSRAETITKKRKVTD